MGKGGLTQHGCNKAVKLLKHAMSVIVLRKECCIGQARYLFTKTASRWTSFRYKLNIGNRVLLAKV